MWLRQTAIASTCTALLLAGVCAARLCASEGNELTYLTFSAPVEIPGQVLPAGTYQFRLANPLDDRNIIQIMSKDGKTLYATLLTIPDEHLTPTDTPVVTFEERASGAPPAIRAFFYPGDTYGQEFVYPKERARQFAQASHHAVPSMSPELTTKLARSTRVINESDRETIRLAPLSAISEVGEEVPVPTVITVHKRTAQSAAPTATTGSTAASKKD